mgnify:CR=1 FL=1
MRKFIGEVDMKFDGLKQLAEKGKLKLHKYGFNTAKRRYIYNSDEEYEKTKIWIKEVKIIAYIRHKYFARSDDMPENQQYKITSKDYKELLKIGAKEE